VKYIAEFRDARSARGLAAAIAREVQPEREYRLMEFCGGHTHAISRYGIADLLPGNIRLVHGPGCPVCVLPMGCIDSAIELALEHRVMLLAYGDCLRVPASGGMSLMKARARGADVRMVYSTQDALRLARANPERSVVFFAIGFETTAPATAVAVLQAKEQGLANFSVFCNHVLTPPAIEHILATPAGTGEVAIDGLIGPAHVSTVIGSLPYERFARDYGKPLVIAGFEPLDVMQAIRMLVAQLNEGRAEVQNQFTRAVTREGNVKAQRLLAEVFEPGASFEWRGLGVLPSSALALNERYRAFDAAARFRLAARSVPDHKACECGAVLRGQKRPADCRLFATVCVPEQPMGACMVSSEGACAAHYSYGRARRPAS
jgi:hydrogenase expression/formation protein HypD